MDLCLEKRIQLLSDNLLASGDDDKIVAQAHLRWPNNKVFKRAVHVASNFTSVCTVPIGGFVDWLIWDGAAWIWDG